MSKLSFDELPNQVKELNEKMDRIEKLLSFSIKSTDEFEDVFDVNQTANFLNITVSALRGKIQRKIIPYSKSGRRIFFIKATLIEWLKDRSVSTREDIENAARNHIAKRKK